MANSENPETEKMLRAVCLKYLTGAAFDALPALRALLVKVREADARKAGSFTGALSAAEWPPHGLVEAEKRFDGGFSAITAERIAKAIRSQNYADLMEEGV